MNNYKDLTIESYNQNSIELARKFERLNLDDDRITFLNLLKTKHILDLGCGAGEHSLHFKEKGLNVQSIDLSEEMIKLCKDKQVNAKIMDIENLEFEENTFDGIWAVTCLLHIPKENIRSVVSKLHSILKEKGILYVCVKEGQGEGFIKDKSNDETQRFFSLFTHDEIITLFQKQFSVIETTNTKIGKTTFLKFFFQKKD